MSHCMSFGKVISIKMNALGNKIVLITILTMSISFIIQLMYDILSSNICPVFHGVFSLLLKIPLEKLCCKPTTEVMHCILMRLSKIAAMGHGNQLFLRRCLLCILYFHTIYVDYFIDCKLLMG